MDSEILADVITRFLQDRIGLLPPSLSVEVVHSGVKWWAWIKRDGYCLWHFSSWDENEVVDVLEREIMLVASRVREGSHAAL